MPTFAPNFQFKEDIPHVSGDPGTAALVVRKDVAASLADTDGDYSLLIVDASGRLHVVLPVGASTEATLAAFKVENDANLDLINASLDAIEASVANIDTDFDVALSSRATESTLAAFKTENDSNLDLVNSSLDALESVLTHSIKFAVISASLLGDNTVVPGVALKKIRVLGYVITVDSVGLGFHVTWKSGATPISGDMFIDTGLHYSYAGSILGPAFETAVGSSLILNIDGAIARNIRGHLSYIEVS
jgi:hypothetical protein